jgi:hypothetical protein
MPQTSIVTALNGGLSLSRAPRPRPRPDHTPVLSTNTLCHRIRASVAVSGDLLATRRWDGGTAKQAVLTAFIAHRITVAKAIERGETVKTDDKNEPNLRNSYTREHKLAAVDYALYT